MEPVAARALHIGLTGGIGSGKSTVAAIFVAHGATLVDTDAIAREITLPGGAAIAQLKQAFGAGILDADGGLDRAAMRSLAFSDHTARRRLEAILHPLIGTEADRQAGLAAAGTVLFDVPLLAESRRWRDRVARVLVIDCSEATQLARVAQRPGWTEASAGAVIAQQASRAARRACADAVIYNDGLTPAALAAEVATICGCWGIAH
ncbi:MAG TPA: dephospho-CoA kinase [Burkholderiaceae bacterium]|nr:dephospho-CoA kinase [Burkholderiaceae bacterium]